MLHGWSSFILVTTFLRLSCLLPVLTSTALLDSPTQAGSPKCDCYLISGPEQGYFQHHRFWDFRNVPNDGENDYTVSPPLITAQEDAGSEDVTSSIFDLASWDRDWNIQSWAQDATDVSPVRSVNSPRNVYFSRNITEGASNSTYLTLRASRLRNFMSISEVDSQEISLLHSSVRARIRIIPPSLANPTSTSAEVGIEASKSVAHGAVFGLFTYNSSICESDIEILTRDPHTHVRYTNQPDYDAKTDTSFPGATADVVMPDGYLWTEWLEHRMDWTDSMSRWWVDGVLAANKSVNVPNHGSGVILNLWGDGGVWSGNMTVGDVVAAGVEWIEIAFNVTGQTSQKRCDVGCSIDWVKKVGSPEVAFNVTGASSGASKLMGHERGRVSEMFVGLIFSVGYSLFVI